MMHFAFVVALLFFCAKAITFRGPCRGREILNVFCGLGLSFSISRTLYGPQKFILRPEDKKFNFARIWLVSRSGREWAPFVHSLCSICMPRDVPLVRLGGVWATRLHASGTDHSQLLLKVRGSGGSLFCTYGTLVFRAFCATRVVSVLTFFRTHIHSYSRISSSFALPDSRLL